jgi:hypothetical protein
MTEKLYYPKTLVKAVADFRGGFNISRRILPQIQGRFRYHRRVTHRKSAIKSTVFQILSI